MAGTEYTLTGFDDFLERRRIAFVEPLPSTRVCGVCGVVPSRSLVLPCGHVLCQACKRQIVNADQKCPMDSREFAEAAVVSINFRQPDLEQHRVLCVVGGRECSFAGRLGDLKEHLVGCSNDRVRCAECQQSVLRSVAVQHCRQCDVKATARPIMSTTVIASAVEKLGCMKTDLEKLRQQASSEEVDQDAVLNGANSLVERMSCLERELIQEGKRVSGEQHNLLLPAAEEAGVTAGPYRTLSEPGVFTATCKFCDIYDGYNALTRGEEITLSKKSVLVDSKEIVLAGYTFKLDCTFLKQDKKDVLLTFDLILGNGDFDDWLKWPFAKKVTVILWHPRGERKDVRLPVSMEDPDMVKKPAPGSWNDGISTGTVTWKDIEFHGYVVSDSVYVKIEFA